VDRVRGGHCLEVVRMEAVADASGHCSAVEVLCNDIIA